MRTNTRNTLSVITLSIALGYITVGCGTGADQSDSDALESTTEAAEHSSSQDGNNTMEVTADGSAEGVAINEGTATMGSNEIRINGSAVGSPAYNERYAASKDVRGYRALLMAELDAIRARLNDGSRAADVTVKDQARAADLAQGLERMDRLILAVEESDDLTWTSIRTSSLKEAGEVRVWATEHGYTLNS